MKPVHSDDTDELHRLAVREDWITPLPGVSRLRLSRCQKVVFWGLRIYIVLMVAVVAWAFATGHIAS